MGGLLFRDKLWKMDFQLFLSIDRTIVPTRLFDLLNSHSFFWVKHCHSIKEVSEITREVWRGFALEFTMLFPKLRIIEMKQLIQVDFFIMRIFCVRPYPSAEKDEKHNASWVNISSGPIFALLISELGWSMKPCSFCYDRRVSDWAREVKVCNFETVIFSNQQVFKLDVKVRNALTVKKFKAINKLMEIGPTKLFSQIVLVIQDEIKKVAMRSKFRCDIGCGDKIVFALDDFVLLKFDGSYDIWMAQRGKLDLILKESSIHRFFTRKDFHGVFLSFFGVGGKEDGKFALA